MSTPLDPVAFAEKVRRQRTVKKPSNSAPSRRTVIGASDLDDDGPPIPLPEGVVQLNEHPRRVVGRTAPNGTVTSMVGSTPNSTRVAPVSTISISDRTTRQRGSNTAHPSLMGDTLPPTQMVIPSGTSLVSSSCNVDHDNDLIRRILVGYMQRKKEEGLVSQVVASSTSEGPDIFMDSIMSVSKLCGVLGKAAPVAKVNPPPTKIPQRHWVVRETMYARSDTGRRETGAVFLDLKNHRRAVVFPSAQPCNRPEVYYLAQTLDLLLKEVGGAMGGLDSLVAEDACYRIVAEDATTEDPQLEEPDKVVSPPAPKIACSAFFDKGMQVWEVLDAGLTEVARQITPTCAERGVLVEALRSVATDLGTTALRVMQFCKEEACNQQAENAALEYEWQGQEEDLRVKDAEIARLQAVVEQQNTELEELRVVNERFQAMRTQIQLSAALLVRNDRLRPLLEAMEAADTERQQALGRAMEADTRAGVDGVSEADRERRKGLADHEIKLRDLYESCNLGNPQLALLASGVGGIDITAVKQLVSELDFVEGRSRGDDKKVDTSKEGGASEEEVDMNGELYQEAIRYLLTLDEAVEAIDSTCEPFYQKMVFRDPALNTALAAGRWRAVAKAMGRHEMVLEQRERQWRAAMVSTTRRGPQVTGGDGGVVQRVLNSLPGYSDTGSVLEGERLKHVTGTEGGHLRGTSHEDGILEKQLALAKIFRGATRNALLGVHAEDNDEGLSNVGGMAGGPDAPIVDPSMAEAATSQPEVQEFLNPNIMLPPSFAMGSAGVAKLFRETRTVLVEIVQRLCALALSSQFKNLVSDKVLLPPDEPNVPCDLCGRIEVADTANKFKNDAMVEFASEASRIQRRLEDDVRDLEEEISDLRRKLGTALRHEKESEQKATASAREGADLKKELRMMREIEGLRHGQSASDLHALAEQRDADSESRSALAFSPGAGNRAATSGSVIQRLIQREDDDGEDAVMEPTATGFERSLPLVLELVINCSCCGGGGAISDSFGAKSALKSSSTKADGMRGGGEGSVGLGEGGGVGGGLLGAMSGSTTSLFDASLGGGVNSLNPKFTASGTGGASRAPDLTASIHGILSSAIGNITSSRHPRPPTNPKAGSRPGTPTGDSQSMYQLGDQAATMDDDVPAAIQELGLFSEEDERKLVASNAAASREQWAAFGARFLQPPTPAVGGGQMSSGAHYLPTGAGMGDGPLLERKRAGQLYPHISNPIAMQMTNVSDPRIEKTLNILQTNIAATEDVTGRPGLASATQTRRHRRMQLFGLSRLSLTKSLGWLLRIVARFYHSKLAVDLTAIQEHGPGVRLVSASEHLSNTLRNMFGTKGLIDAHAADIIRCCCQYFRVDPRVANVVKFLSEDIHDAKMLFFFTRLSRAVDCCITGLSYQHGTVSGFCNDEDQTTLEKVSLARIRGVLRQTRLIKKPYASALWDVLCDLSTSESNSVFKAAQRRAGIVLVGTEQYPKEWSVDDVSRGRMTIPKSMFLSITCYFEQALRDEERAIEAAQLSSKPAAAPLKPTSEPKVPPVLPDHDELLSAISQESLLDRLQSALDSGRLPQPKGRPM